MSSAAEILVIILSITLTVFLIVGIILAIYLIILTRQIRRVTETAGKAFDDVESVVSGLAKIISPIYITEMFTRFIKKLNINKKKRGK
jgi:uncharacterized protein YoxC